MKSGYKINLLQIFLLFSLILLVNGEALANTLLVGDPTPDGDPISCGDQANPCDTIQNAIDIANAGDILDVAAGEYFENLVVGLPLTIQGAGQEETFLYPALSAPNPCSNTSLCSGASNLILVRADDVTIHDLTLDGNNPNLTSTVIVDGEDVDARNGIITDFNHMSGVFNNTEVFNVTLKNIYLRGIQSADSAGFYFHDNQLQNVGGDIASIAIYNYGGSGVIENNMITGCEDGIASNWSVGTQFLNNTVIGCYSGVHTDNAGADPDSEADIIYGNAVHDCEGPIGGTFGVWTFVSYLAPLVEGNWVENCDFGLCIFGQEEGDPPVFRYNHSENNGTGVLMTTDIAPFGSRNVSSDFISNQILDNDVGFFFQSQNGFELDANVHFNRIVGNSINGVRRESDSGTYNIDLANNWWGCNDGPNDVSANCDTVDMMIINSLPSFPWLVLTLEAAPQTLFEGENSSLSAKIIQNSNGEDTSSLGNLPDGNPVDFTTDLGSVDPAQDFTVGGMASSLYSADAGPGQAQISATFDDQTVTIALNVEMLTEPGGEDELDQLMFMQGGIRCRLVAENCYETQWIYTLLFLLVLFTLIRSRSIRLSTSRKD